MSTEHPSKDMKYYTDLEIAGLLGISLGRLRNKLCAGSPLPPRIQPPGCRNRLWPCQAVHDWLEQFTITVTDPVTPDREPRRQLRIYEGNTLRAGLSHMHGLRHAYAQNRGSHQAGSHEDACTL